jgi:hypothetical protein
MARGRRRRRRAAAAKAAAEASQLRARVEEGVRRRKIESGVEGGERAALEHFFGAGAGASATACTHDQRRQTT